jgi:hypothetical protein
MLTRLPVWNSFKNKAFIPLTLLLMSLVGCADLNNAPSVGVKQYHGPSTQMAIAGGDATMQAWTQEAVTAYCAKKYWPASIKKTAHSHAGNQPSFNEPRKTKVLVNKDNTLHIHFQLGGVLMDNFSHELVVYPPHVKQCKAQPLHYEVTMQPQGNAVIYMSKPQNHTSAQ